MTRLAEVFRFELDYQLRRVSTRIYFAIFLAMSLAATLAFLFDARRDGYFFNAPIITIAVTVVGSMVVLLVSAAVAGDAAARDAEARIEPLLYTTRIHKAAYLGGRFLGAFTVTALILLAVPLALILATLMPGVTPRMLGPFRPDAYLTAYFLFALPNAFFSTAALFSIAALTRRAIASYAPAAVIFFSAFITEGFLAARLGEWKLGKLLDPVGFTITRSLWRSLNPLQKNTILGIDEMLLANRLLWIGMAVVVLALTYARFRFAHQAGAGRSRSAVEIDDVPAIRWTGIVVPATRRAFGVSTRMRQLLAVTGRSFRDLVTSRTWLIVPIVAVLFIATAPAILSVELGTPGAATTGRVAMIYGTSELSLLILLLIALSAGELVWRERDARIDAIADVAPVPEWVSLLGKFLGLALMLAAAHAVFLVSGVVVQILQHADRVDLGLYVDILFGFQLTGFLILAAMAMVVHTLVNQKYVANVIIVLTSFATDVVRELGVRHNLLLYGSTPGWSYSEMAGFGGQVGPWLWFTLYWAGWALLFGVATYLFWIRGQERGARMRLALARRRLTRWPAAMGALAVTIIAGAGGFVFYNTNVRNHYDSDAMRDQRSAEYERHYRKYAAATQPVLAATKLQVDFYPSRGAATVRGTYRLVNRSAVAIDAIHVATSASVATRNVTFDRPSRPTLVDDDLGFRIYTLGRALQPGQSVQMNFEVDFEPRGFTNDGADSTVIANGSWIEHRGEQTERLRQWLPAIGYEPGRELTGGSRALYGLPAHAELPPLEDPRAPRVQRSREKIDFEAIVGTEGGQIGVATGELRRTWSANGRTYAQYVADAPISNGFAIYSARYDVRRAAWNGVPIEIYHHPGHTANLDRMVRSVRASLDYNTREFGPYRHRLLRLIEFPSSGQSLGLSAHESAIKYSEGYSLVRTAADPRGIDVPFAVLAHEMGHQWWGHKLVPALVEGAPVLSESLAWYSAMMVVERTYGREHLLRLLDVMHAEYLAPQETRAVPLLRAVDRIDAYRTGPFAMFALRETIGEERVNTALRRLIARFDPNRPPYPTTLDLYAELRAVTPPSMQYLLKDLFEDITYWDLRTKKVDVVRAGGAYRVTLEVEARKLKADPGGQEKEVPMNDAIAVVVLDAGGKALYRRQHRIRSGAQTITVTVPRSPARGGLDPDHVLLDREPEDNVIAVAGS